MGTSQRFHLASPANTLAKGKGHLRCPRGRVGSHPARVIKETKIRAMVEIKDRLKGKTNNFSASDNQLVSGFHLFCHSP
jgi:hypothetical protein